MADQGTEGFLSPFLRRKRITAALPYLQGRVLDFGCGSGALAQWLPPDRYLGMEIDHESIERAQANHLSHRFHHGNGGVDEKFDTVVSLAVIEHVRDPSDFLRTLSAYLSPGSDARIVVTTPHPSMDWVHESGAKIGLFSWHASDEHEQLLGENELRIAGASAGLDLVVYKRFLLGANQIAVFRRQGR